jgi:hypothetical protein
VGDRSPSTENASSAFEPSSEVLWSKVAASTNKEQSNPVQPPLHTHTDVGMHLPFELQFFGQDARTDGAADPAGAVGLFAST